MRRSILLVAALLTLPLVAPPVFAASKILKVGYFRTEPHVIPKEGGAPTGAAIDYFKKFIAPEMGVEVEYVGPMAVPRLVSGLEDGSLDAIVLLAKNPERAGKFSYPSQPFDDISSAVVVLNESPLKSVTSPKDLYGLTVGVGQGVFIHPMFRDDKIKYEPTAGTDWLPMNLKKLEAKRFDATYIPDRFAAAYEAKLLNLMGKIRIIDVPNTGGGIYTVFSKKNAELATAYDAALKKVKAKTTYEALLAPYLK